VRVRSPVNGTPVLMPNLGPVTSAVLFHGIEGAPAPPHDASAWDAVLPTLVREGLAGLALDSLGGETFEGVDDIRSTLVAAHRAEIAMSSIARSKTDEVVGLLSMTGIGAVVVKGPGIAARYRRPAARPYEDLDIVVATGRFRDALTALDTHGFVGPPAPRPWFPILCREGVNLWRGDGASIDLHHRVPPWIFGRRLNYARLRRSSRLIEQGGTEMRVAGDVHNLLIAALQLVGFRTAAAMKLKAWRDVYELGSVVDPNELASESRALDLEWYVASVLAELPPYARHDGPLEALGRVAGHRWKRARLRAVMPPSIGSRNFSVGRLFRLPVPNGMAYLTAKAVPSRSFLVDMYGSRWAYVRWWRGAGEHLLESAAEADATSPT
jgi:putative nucleotidyltransferase-like protein